MQRVVTNSVRSLVFCLSTASIKTRIHFFPSAGAAGGHLPISCLLTLFGKGVEKRSVLLDGGRLNQPDGLRLEDAFPALRGDVSGVFGLEIQLSCSQGRVNLLHSQTAIEFVSSTSSMVYGGAPFSPMTEETDDQSLPSVTDRLQASRERSPAGVAMQDALAHFVTCDRKRRGGGAQARAVTRSRRRPQAAPRWLAFARICGGSAAGGGHVPGKRGT